jgi:hypothetical protein
MPRLSFLLVLLVLLPLQAFSQNDKQPGSRGASNLFIELAGNAGVLSLNYDRRFSNSDNGIGGRIGVGFGTTPGHFFPQAVVTVPVVINYLAGNGPNYLEAGAGVTMGVEKFGGKYRSDGRSVYFVPSIGYRRQPISRGFTFRAFVSPFIASRVSFSGGLSFGVRL